MDLETIQKIGKTLENRVGQVVIGAESTLKLLLISLLAEGHILLEGVPGTAKTLLARTFAASFRLDFKRIQFTPDLMPSDVIGTNLFNFQTGEFRLIQGPIFTQFLLADEINRTPPKTQAALLEAMQERTVTIEGTGHELSRGFIVVATQNPIEQEGTYPLPEAQLDRFLFKVQVQYPTREQECKMVQIHGHQTAMPDLKRFQLEPICDLSTLLEARKLVAGLRLSEPMIGYIVDLIRATRSHPSLLFGASPRSANMVATVARAVATLEGRDFVIPDDVKSFLGPILRHRLVLSPEAELEGLTTDRVLEKILNQVPAPR